MTVSATRCKEDGMNKTRPAGKGPLFFRCFFVSEIHTRTERRLQLTARHHYNKAESTVAELRVGKFPILLATMKERI